MNNDKTNIVKYSEKNLIRLVRRQYMSVFNNYMQKCSRSLTREICFI